MVFHEYQLKAAYTIHFHDKKRYSMDGISERKCRASFQAVKSSVEKVKGIPDLQQRSWDGGKERDTFVWRREGQVMLAASFCGDACDNQYSRL
ncbi:hypothetical protein A6A05_19690 [Magnetospirillum moscoviense]|uniref:Uncharacterized protein n=2 Tax=Magnetospirillum moscoviense TaxID=1437059 RepID=A0A178MY65_9PROT|nr:hypothetical protein A6A05_19690 [Magnetospirillum moscoviense]